MNLRRLIPVLILALLLMFTLMASGKESSVRVITYNIRYDNPADSLNNWKYRRDFIATMLKFYGPDIIGIQEGLIHQVHELAAALRDYAWCGTGRDDGKEAGEFLAIFYNKERFALVRNSTFWLSPTPEVPSKGWDAALNRIVTWAELRDKATGHTLFAFNTHFDHQGKSAREESARLLIRRIREIAKDRAVVLTGDFNSSDTEPPYAILTAKSTGQTAILTDAMTLSKLPHHGPLNTYSGFDVHQGIIGERIDFVFVSPMVEVLKHATLSDFKSDEHFPSDHLPVMADFVLP